ncbi:MAG: succinate dehydrogenase iron-sulfur subunit [Conexivisphaerales archaeon]
MTKLLVSRTDKIQEYVLEEVDEYTTVLEALLWVRENRDPTLAFRYSCRMGLCGSCSMEINGRPRLACQTRLSDLQEKVSIRPLRGYQVVKDLVPDLTNFFERYSSVKPYLLRDDKVEQENPSAPYTQIPENVEDYLQFNYCIQCGICFSACPVTREDPNYLGPAALNVAYRYTKDSRDLGFEQRTQLVDIPHGIWECRVESLCSEYCPKGVDPSLAIQKYKSIILRKGRV